MTSPSPSSNPSLPTELKKEILLFCDPSSLATACLASTAFLELAGPVLYNDITINGLEGLSRLGPPRARLPPPLSSFLSLTRCESLTFVGIPEDRAWSLNTSEYGLPSSNLLRIPISTLRVNFDVADGMWDSEIEPSRVSFLNLFNPTHAHLSVPLPVDRAWLPLPSFEWTRLRSLTFDGCWSEDPLFDAPLFSPQDDENAPLAVEFSFSRYTSDEIQEWISFLVRQMRWNSPQGRTREMSWLRGRSQISGVVVRVGTEDQARVCWEKAERLWEEYYVPEKEVERIKRDFRVEIR